MKPKRALLYPPYRRRSAGSPIYNSALDLSRSFYEVDVIDPNIGSFQANQYKAKIARQLDGIKLEADTSNREVYLLSKYALLDDFDLRLRLKSTSGIPAVGSSGFKFGLYMNATTSMGLMVCYTGGARKIYYEYVVAGTPSAKNIVSVTLSDHTLRIIRAGTTISTWYTPGDGSSWTSHSSHDFGSVYECIPKLSMHSWEGFPTGSVVIEGILLASGRVRALE